MSPPRLFGLLVLATGCSLIAPASDSFDARGVETIAVVDTAVDALVIAGRRLFVAAGTTLLTKSIDDTAPLSEAATTPGAFTGLVGDGEAVVAWCDGAAYALVSGGAARRLPGSSRCGAIAARAGVVAWVETDGEVAARAYDVVHDTPGAVLALPTTDPTGTSIGLGADGVVNVGSAVGLARACQTTDLGCEDGLCRLGSFTPSSPTLAVIGTGAGARIVWFDALVGDRTAPVTTCCAFAAKSCPADALRGRRSAGSAGTTTVHGDQLFVLRDGAVKVAASFADPTFDRAVAPAVANARLLAVGADRAVFVDGSHVLRVRYALDP